MLLNLEELKNVLGWFEITGYETLFHKILLFKKIRTSTVFIDVFYLYIIFYQSVPSIATQILQ